MFNFPSSPTEGQTYTAPNGSQYVFQSPVWMQVSAAQIKATALLRNRIVNGTMQISQEWGNTAGGPTSAMNYWAADQWVGLNSTTGTCTLQRVQVVTPNGSRDRLRLTVNTADASLAAGEFQQIFQPIEGVRVADFRWGSAQAKPVVLRFGFKGPAGTYSAGITNATVARSYVANFTISAAQANTDTEQVLVIPGDVTGTWPTDNSASLYVRFTLAAGSTYTGAAGWQAGFRLVTASNSNGLATAGNIFELFDVGLYADPQATGAAPPWEMPDEAEELAACMRYYQKDPSGTNVILAFGGIASFASTVWYGDIQFPVTMRSAPSAQITMTGSSNVSSTPVLNVISPWGARWGFTAPTANTSFWWTGYYFASARM